MKKALITWGGWDGHEPEACGRIFESLLKEKGYEVIFTDSLDCYTDKALMDSLDLIVPVWTMSEISEDQWKGLKEAVISGCGIAGWHGGMGDSFRQNVEYQFMVGGQWVAHPGGVIDYTIQITSDDPIVAGYTELKMKSEQYYMHVDPSNEVLAETTFAGDQEDINWIRGTVMPVAWKRTYGKARVFYSSIGHVASDFDVPGAKEIMLRGMLWASR
ncbi:MAG: ThuA domain-containing protein [Spirochaetales bacterium]|nr:ThuA domain-containing protein [Spirochaetales bacterium]